MPSSAGRLPAYRDAEGIFHVQFPKVFNWSDWDAKRKGSGSGEGGRVGHGDKVVIGHSGGERHNQVTGKAYILTAGASSGQVVGGASDNEPKLHVQTPAGEVHKIPKENIKSVVVNPPNPAAAPKPKGSK